jgi:hypothetical protein
MSMWWRWLVILAGLCGCQAALALPSVAYFDLVAKVEDLPLQSVTAEVAFGESKTIDLGRGFQVELIVFPRATADVTTKVRFLDVSSGTPVEVTKFDHTSKSFEREYRFAYCGRRVYMWMRTDLISPLSCENIDVDFEKAEHPPHAWTPIGSTPAQCAWFIDKSRTYFVQHFFAAPFLSECPGHPERSRGVLRQQYWVVVDCYAGFSAVPRIDWLDEGDARERRYFGYMGETDRLRFEPLREGSIALVQARALCKRPPPFELALPTP